MAPCQKSKPPLGAEDYPGLPTEVGPAVRKSLTMESVRDKARDALMQAGLDATLKEALTSVFSTPRAGGDGEKKKADDNKADDNKTAPVPTDDENEKGGELTELFFFAHPCPAVSEHDSYKLELLERLTRIGMKAEHAKRLRVALREGSTIVEIFGPSLLKADMQALPLRNLKMRGCRAMLSRKELEEHAICEQLPPASDEDQSETELRNAIMAALEPGAASGKLEGFLKGLNAQVSDHELEDLCHEAQQFVLAAAKDGRLADALGTAQKANPKAVDMGKDEDLHTLVQSTLAQACTNGKLETASREDTNSISKDKGQKQAGASATGEGIDNLRQLMCDTLAKANESGALEAVLRDCNKVDGKSVKKSDIDDMRRVTVDALGDGSLERGLQEAMAAAPVLAGGAAAAGGKEATSAKESEALRTDGRDMLGEESLNGTLEENLKFSSTRVEDELEDMLSKVRNMLSQAAADGSLERAEEVVLLVPEAKQNVHHDSASGAPKEEDLRLQVRKVLEQPVADGNLQKVAETQDNQDRDPAFEDARLKILESLITANRDGSLGKALETLACTKPPPGPKIDSQGIREKARTILTQDTADGNFGQVFEELRCQQPDEPEVEDIRKKVSGILEAACASGALEEAFKDLSSPKAQDESLASIRREMSDVLSQVLASGSLEGAVAGGSAPAREQEVPKELKVVEALSTLGNAQEDKPTRTDALRLETSRMYTLEDGCLEKALRTTVQDPEDMCPRAFDALVAASDSGALEAAMRRLSSHRAAESPPSKHLPLTPQAPSKPHTGQIRPSGRARSEVAYPANSGAVWVLSEVRKRDGRVGELVSMIRETERQIEDRERQCRWLDESLDSTRADVAHIALDIEWHKCALGNAIERSSELEATQGKLTGELEGQEMKLRSTKGTLPSARSNTSTEVSGFDAMTSSMETTMSWSRMLLSTRPLEGTLDSIPLCR